MAEKPIRVRVHVESGPQDRAKADEVHKVVDAVLQSHGLKRDDAEAKNEPQTDGGVVHREYYTK